MGDDGAYRKPKSAWLRNEVQRDGEVIDPLFRSDWFCIGSHPPRPDDEHDGELSVAPRQTCDPIRLPEARRRGKANNHRHIREQLNGMGSISRRLILLIILSCS